MTVEEFRVLEKLKNETFGFSPLFDDVYMKSFMDWG